MQLIGQEIERLEQESKDVKSKIVDKWAKKREELEKKWHVEVADAEKKYNEKIKELEDQISSLKAQSPVN
jgi:phage host-nuclease inhibitor protein Gam